MELVFLSEARFEKGIDGKVYSPDGGMGIAFWNRYLEKFDRITVIARVLQTGNSYAGQLIAESDRVSFVELPYYIGVAGFFKNIFPIRKVIREQAVHSRAYLCRGCGLLAEYLIDALREKRIPYGVEVVGDPWDVFAPGVIHHPLRRVIRWYMCRLQKKIVNGSSATLYVTKASLQRRYPVKQGAFEINASDVFIDAANLPTEPHTISNKGRRIDFISVGSLAQMYKSPDVVIAALGILKSRGVDCHLKWCGGGCYLKAMEELAETTGVADMISFVGSITGAQVRDNLARADIFLLASRTEGLPRAVIEAMSMGLACIGSKAGGIPELLEPSALVEIGDPVGLADKMEEFIVNREATNKLAGRNFIEARNYYDTVLSERRRQFLGQLIKIS